MDRPEPDQRSEHRLAGLKLVSLLTLLSRFTGLARDSLMASLFGTGWLLDAFTFAFRVPNMFRRLFGEGALTAAFLPMFVQVDKQKGRGSANLLFSGVAWRLLKILLSFLIFIEIVLGAILIALPMSYRSTLLCELGLILMPYMLLICMAGLYAAALNGVQHFLTPALVPIVLNLTWLGGGCWAALNFSSGPTEIRWIAAFITSAGFLQLAVVAWKARQYGIRFQNPTSSGNKEAKAVFRLMAPVLLGLSITQINGIVDTLMAWVLSSGNLADYPSLEHFRLPTGTAGALYLGQRLLQFPQGVFAVALGTVLFPRFAKHATSKDRDELNRDVTHGLQLVLLVGIPSSVGLWFMAAPITNLLFRYGQFDGDSAYITAQMIGSYGLGVWIVSGLLIVNRVFYAVGDQITPMRLGIACVGLNLIFDVIFVPMLGGPALPIASMTATLFQFALSLEALRGRFLNLQSRFFGPLLWRIVVGSLLMNLAGLGMLYAVSPLDGTISEFMYRLIKVVVPVAVSALVYAIALKATGLSLKKIAKDVYQPAG